jgi:hypothetical protein
LCSLGRHACHDSIVEAQLHDIRELAIQIYL